MKQHRLSLIALLLGGFAAPFAQASSDDGCYPDWSLIHHQLDACSNLPFLSPGNDSQVNLRLLLTDAGQASLPEYPVSEYDRTLGYGPVPFNLAMLSSPLDRIRHPGGCLSRRLAALPYQRLGGAANAYAQTSCPVSPSSATTRSRLGTYMTPSITIGTAVELPPS